jgi:hypothetical protein
MTVPPVARVEAEGAPLEAEPRGEGLRQRGPALPDIRV